LRLDDGHPLKRPIDGAAVRDVDGRSTLLAIERPLGQVESAEA
jgi:hypothetical protein